MGMKVLIVGGGGREHAIATCVAKSPKVDKIYCAPGNAGIGQIAECVPIGAMEFDKIVAFAKEQAIDLTIVGMDDPLVGGLVDALEAVAARCEDTRSSPSRSCHAIPPACSRKHENEQQSCNRASHEKQYWADSDK